jgi:hypothetical protein
VLVGVLVAVFPEEPAPNAACWLLLAFCLHFDANALCVGSTVAAAIITAAIARTATRAIFLLFIRILVAVVTRIINDSN